jgi:radical SAM superfamily enzyme YgiQ (UPF0313 family)
MRVLLAQPPLLPGAEVTPPLGLCTLAAWLLGRGHQVHIVDLDLEMKAAPGDWQTGYADWFTATVRDFRPNVVGVTSMYSNSLQGERLLQAVKNCDPGIVTVAGGSHFGALGEHALRRIPELDYVIAGEGEVAFASLLEALAERAPLDAIPRLCYRAHGQSRANPAAALMNLADLPPVWSGLGDSIRLERYRATVPETAARRVIYVEAGRGCPFACTFCATAPFWEHRFRVKLVHHIVDEIRFLHERLGYDSFILVHDLLTVNQRFIAEFCDAMLEARLPVEWMANSRTDLRLHGLLPKMKAAGCWKLFFGIESADDGIQHAIDKHLNLNDAVEHLKDLRDHGIGATCSFVIGFPSETPRQLSPTLALGARLKLLGAETVQFHRLRLFPPSRLTRSAPPGAFDLDSLRVEYPFLEVPQEDVAAIREDAQFFAGYFPPLTAAGTPFQLAQVEMFFHHAVALAPFTVATLACFAAEELVPSFYQALSRHGPLARSQLDWESGALYHNWLALRPLLTAWLSEVQLAPWQGNLARGVLTYEEQRLQFVKGVPEVLETAVAVGENWAAFLTNVDLAGLLQRLLANAPLTEDLLVTQTAAFVRRGEGSFAAYLIEPGLTPNLVAQDPTLVAALQQ